jgi:SAM-dependent methyltransferase
MREAFKVLARRHPLVRVLARAMLRLRAYRAWILSLPMSDPIERAGLTGYFSLDDVDEVARVVFDEGTASPRFEPLRHAHLTLPDWFAQGLDPYSPEYAAQQVRLWQAIAGVDRPYEPLVDEKEAPVEHADPIRFPAYFMRRDADAVRSASDHILAQGMILKHSVLKPGDHALEYGAGFGQVALSLARLGVQVHTVDISKAFCEFVRQQAEHFQVPLQSHFGLFGDNPMPDLRYQLIWFYESFHHCLDWPRLLERLKELLAPGGRVVLCGEPMAVRQYAAVPYPWGVRLHSEVVATIRRFRWFELGFTEDFLFEMFHRSGFSLVRYDCEPSLWGRTYVAEPLADELHVGRMWMPPAMSEQEWHAAEPDGRWTRGDARLWLRRDVSVRRIELDLANPSQRPVEVSIECGRSVDKITLRSGAQLTMAVSDPTGAHVRLRCKTHRPSRRLRLLGGADERQLGVFVRRLRYVP